MKGGGGRWLIEKTPNWIASLWVGNGCPRNPRRPGVWIQTQLNRTHFPFVALARTATQAKQPPAVPRRVHPIRSSYSLAVARSWPRPRTARVRDVHALSPSTGHYYCRRRATTGVGRSGVVGLQVLPRCSCTAGTPRRSRIVVVLV